MTVNKRKKNSRQHGSKTHGSGIGSKHNKGSGNRGGVGNAGTGKRADTKKPSIWKDPKYFGKYGFTSRSRTPFKIGIGIKTIEDRIFTLEKKGLAKQDKGSYVINLEDLGYNMLLSTGTPTKKLIITAEYATDKAVEKITGAGGSVKLTGKPKAEKADKKAAEE